MVFLEDESGRIELEISRFGNYPWVTGTTLGLKGSADSAGRFFIHEIIEPGIPKSPQVMPLVSSDSPKFIALVSGLNYGKDGADFSLQRNQMFDLLNGCLHVIISL